MNSAGRGGDAENLLRLIGGKWVTAAIAAAAELGLPGALADRPATSGTLADELSCDAPSLERLMRVLASVGLLESDLDGVFSLTSVGRLLGDDHFGPLARYVGSESQWAPWCKLADSVRHGTSAFQLWHGKSLFEFMDEHPEPAATYHEGVDAFARRQARALAGCFDFTGFTRVADVGGGWGTLLTELLTALPNLTGVLFDRPTVVAEALLRLTDHPTSGRLTFSGGSFFESVPTGADAIVLKHVLHNWDDEAAQKILQNCVAALPVSGRVLVIEGILLPGNVPDATRLLDLEMLALCEGGFERSKPQFRALFSAAGLRLEKTIPLVAGTRLLVAAPRR